MKLWWAILFLGSDVLVVSALLFLLCRREQSLPRWLEWFLPLKGRWLWYGVLGTLALAYAALAPVFLLLLIRVLRQG